MAPYKNDEENEHQQDNIQQDKINTPDARWKSNNISPPDNQPQAKMANVSANTPAPKTLS